MVFKELYRNPLANIFNVKAMHIMANFQNPPGIETTLKENPFALPNFLITHII